MTMLRFSKYIVLKKEIENNIISLKIYILVVVNAILHTRNFCAAFKLSTFILLLAGSAGW